jgi:hypothetical protein
MVDNGNQAPSDGEVEVSLFGPGYGESIAIHVGSGAWIVVDSCRDPRNGRPVVLEYLGSFGVSPQAIKLIVATHWHDDHIQGISAMLSECEDAVFACTAAVREREFSVLASAWENWGSELSSGVSEFRKVIRILAQRARTGSRNSAPVFAISGRPIWEQAIDGMGQCVVKAQSPSDAAVLRTQVQLSKLIPRAGTPKLRIPQTNPNHSSAVLTVSVGSVCILLGADLEELDGSPGWTEILESGRLIPASSVFKIPHHGSENGHHPGVWARLLEVNPYGIVAPYVRSSTPLPKPSDCERIRGLTQNAYITRPLTVGSEATSRGGLRLPLITYRELAPTREVGQIRLRARSEKGEVPKWKYGLFKGATSLH